MKVVIYARVSSTNGSQDYDRQVNDLKLVTKNRNWDVEAVFAEKVSGARSNQDRPEFMKMIDFALINHIDKVCVTELSRFGRDTLQILSALEILNQNKISVFIQNYNIETLTEDKQQNPMTQFLVTILAEIAKTERTTIRQRVESGYKNFRASGGQVGRKQGYKKPIETMKEQYFKEIQLIKKQYSLRNIYAITGTSVNTLRKLKTILYQ